MFTFGRDFRYLFADIRSLTRQGEGLVNRFHIDDIVFPFDPNPREHIATAARSARLALQILDHIRLHIPPAQWTALNTAVDIVEKAAMGIVDGAELDTAVNETVKIAFANRPHARRRTDHITILVARAIYAATLACLTGSTGCLNDAIHFALEAVNASQARDLETSIREELCLTRKDVARLSAGQAPPRVPPELAPA
jgi:hypothetical protein